MVKRKRKDRICDFEILCKKYDTLMTFGVLSNSVITYYSEKKGNKKLELSVIADGEYLREEKLTDLVIKRDVRYAALSIIDFSLNEVGEVVETIYYKKQ